MKGSVVSGTHTSSALQTLKELFVYCTRDRGLSITTVLDMSTLLGRGQRCEPTNHRPAGSRCADDGGR